VQDLVPALKRHFDGLRDRLITFRAQEVQVEGWFKGELLHLFSHLLDSGQIDRLGREVAPPGASSKIDLVVSVRGVTHFIELKHWLVGVQRGARLDPPFYFGDPTSVGIVKDVDKLTTAGGSAEKWLLLLLTGNPGSELWTKGLDRFHRKFAPRVLAPITRPDEFPPEYFLALLSLP